MDALTIKTLMSGTYTTIKKLNVAHLRLQKFSLGVVLSTLWHMHLLPCGKHCMQVKSYGIGIVKI